MSEEHDHSRRLLLSAFAGMTLTNVAFPALASNFNNPYNSDTLVAFFSRSGNTRVLAGVIHRTLRTDIFEIEPAKPYPEDYFQTVGQAQNERDNGIKPPLKNTLADFARYQTLYLGFPIWGTTIPPVVQTFLASHKLTNKRLIPFITHGGYGIGDSMEKLTALAAQAQREKPLVMECDQERRTTETVTNWLASIRHS